MHRNRKTRGKIHRDSLLFPFLLSFSLHLYLILLITGAASKSHHTEATESFPVTSSALKPLNAPIHLLQVITERYQSWTPPKQLRAPHHLLLSRAITKQSHTRPTYKQPNKAPRRQKPDNHGHPYDCRPTAPLHGLPAPYFIQPVRPPANPITAPNRRTGQKTLQTIPNLRFYKAGQSDITSIRTPTFPRICPHKNLGSSSLLGSGHSHLEVCRGSTGAANPNSNLNQNFH